MLIMIYSCHKKLHMKFIHRVQIHPNDPLIKLACKSKSFCEDEITFKTKGVGVNEVLSRI